MTSGRCPADTPTDVQQDLGHKEKYAADLVGEGLGRVVVSGVQAEQLLTGYCVGQVELM